MFEKEEILFLSTSSLTFAFLHGNPFKFILSHGSKCGNFHCYIRIRVSSYEADAKAAKILGNKIILADIEMRVRLQRIQILSLCGLANLDEIVRQRSNLVLFLRFTSFIRIKLRGNFWGLALNLL